MIFIIACTPCSAFGEQPNLPEDMMHQARGFGDPVNITKARIEICKEILRITETTENTDAITLTKDWMSRNFFSENAQKETMVVCGIYLKGVIDGRENLPQ